MTTLPMTVSEFRVSKGLTAYRIDFTCPACAHPLRCAIADAGKVERCPKCASSFIVPGEDRRRQIEEREREEQRRAALEHQERILREQAGVKPREPAPTLDRKPASVPRYNELRWVADVLIVLGFIAVALGLLTVIIAIIQAIAEESAVYLLGAVSGLLGAVFGVAAMAAGRFLVAIRDMAINSWHIRRSLEEAQGSHSSGPIAQPPPALAPPHSRN